MLTTEQNGILILLRKSLGICSNETPCAFSDEALQIILSNGVLLTVYASLPPELQQRLKKPYFVTVRQTVLQDNEGEEVLTGLSNAGFKCIALKGWELRKLYPKPVMRQMADLDVLIRPYDYKRVKTVMDKLGYACAPESSWKHDNFYKGETLVELHKRLTDDSSAIQEWEKGIWNRAEVVQDNVFKMSWEDYYTFHFVHLFKDFMNGSLGLRRIADTWLLQKQPINMEAIKNEFEKFGMRTFHERMVKLSRVTMGDEPIDEESEVLLKHAFTFGIYGTDASYKAARIAAMGGSLKSGKIRSALAAVFLPYSRMKAHFPMLEERPFLLPWFWTKRVVRFLIKGDLKKHMQMLNYKMIDEKEFNELKRFFEAGGVETLQRKSRF